MAVALLTGCALAGQALNDAALTTLVNRLLTVTQQVTVGGATTEAPATAAR